MVKGGAWIAVHLQVLDMEGCKPRQVRIADKKAFFPDAETPILHLSGCVDMASGSPGRRRRKDVEVRGGVV